MGTITGVYTTTSDWTTWTSLGDNSLNSAAVQDLYWDPEKGYLVAATGNGMFITGFKGDIPVGTTTAATTTGGDDTVTSTDTSTDTNSGSRMILGFLSLFSLTMIISAS